MDMNRFWEIIESVNWDENSRNVNTTTIGRDLLRKHGREVLQQVRDQYGMLMSELYQRIDKWEDANGRLPNYGGDDSFDDLLAHIMGMGRMKYEEVMENPAAAGEIDAVESFSYVFHVLQDEDEDKDEPSYWSKRASYCINTLLTVNPVSDHDKQVFVELMDRFAKMYVGDIKGATEGFADEPHRVPYQNYNTKLYDRYYKWDANDKHALFANTLADAYTWHFGE